MRKLSALRRRCRDCRDQGMSTAEYAVGTSVICRSSPCLQVSVFLGERHVRHAISRGVRDTHHSR